MFLTKIRKKSTDNGKLSKNPYRSQDTVSKFYPPDNVPSEYEIRKMFSVALEHLIKQAMGNHVYSFNGFLRKQSAGAAIGTTLAGAFAAHPMF